VEEINKIMSEKKYKDALAAVMQDAEQREALAQILVEFIEPGHLTNEFVSVMLGTRSLDAGDLLVKKVRKGIEVRTLVPGAVHLASEITISDRINFVLDGADVKVTYNEWELERGEIGTVDSITSEMRAKLRDFFVTKVFTVLSTVWSSTNTPDNYATVASANWNAGDSTAEAAVRAGIDYINQNTTGAKVVIGSREAMTPTTLYSTFFPSNESTPVAHTADELIMRVFENGWLGKYYGVPHVSIPQVWDNIEDFNTLVPTNLVLIIGEDVGEFITYGDVKSKQWTDMNPTPPQWMLEIYQQFGLIIDNARGIYVLEIT
jgi:hypothetical protein